jgi:streptogramin lyase
MFGLSPVARRRIVLVALIVPLVSLVGTSRALGAPPPITEYPLATQNAWPTYLNPGPDAAMWFCEFMADKVGKITVDGKITEYPLPASVRNPYSMVAGRDGGMWFSGDDVIARITTDGQVTNVYPVPVASTPITLAYAPDNSIWFTKFKGAAEKVGRLTQDGQVTEFDTPARVVPQNANQNTIYGPHGIVSGPDGNIWYSTGDTFVRITPDGKSQTPFYMAEGAMQMIVGPDRAIWFTEQFAGKIGRFTMEAKLTEYPVPGYPRVVLGNDYSTELTGINVGPDGAIWFAEMAGNRIGRVTMSGAVTQFDVPTRQGVPFGVSPGRDGNIYFTELIGNKVGRIQLRGADEVEVGPNTGGHQADAAQDQRRLPNTGTARPASAPAAAYLLPLVSAGLLVARSGRGRILRRIPRDR